MIGKHGLLKQLTRKLAERALEAEMAEHLGHARNEMVANFAGNTRNGKSKKTLEGEFGELSIEIPGGMVIPRKITGFKSRIFL